MAGVRTFRDLVVWQAAMDLSLVVYAATRSFPKDELFGLTQQLRRACVSISSNIAEGWGRGSTGDYLRFLSMAAGSLREVESQTELALRLGYLKDEEAEDLQRRTDEIGRMIHALKTSLNSHR